MKKLLYIFFLLVLLCLPTTSKALATNSSYNNIVVYFIYEDNCNNCDTGKEFLQQHLKDNNRVRPEYIKVDSNKELNKKLREALDIKKEDTPLIIIGTNYFIGFNNKIKENLTEAIKSYENTSDYCDVVSKIRKNEDIKDCVTQNKGIYNQQKEISVFIKVIIVIVSICLLIGAGLIIKKKKLLSRLHK